MAKITPDDLLRAIRTHPQVGSSELCRLLGGINRSTLARAMQAVSGQVVVRGGSRRIRYSLRKSLRGSVEPLPLYRIDEQGHAHQLAWLDLTWPQGSALDYLTPWPWPVEGGMADGWFEGLPYPLVDMRPQGFIGRNFARLHALDLHLPDNPDLWSDDEVTYALSVQGHDQPGDLILGDASYRRFLATRQAAMPPLEDSDLASAYPALAQQSLSHGVAGSSAGGEFPKFTASRRLSDGTRFEAIVKFSGADGSAAVQRWSDLLVCEHLALLTVAEALDSEAAQSAIVQEAGRTFLEVRRFDRHGEFGRSGVCSLASLNAALLGLGPGAWPRCARALQAGNWLAADDVRRIDRIWWFGKWIANTDMHEGNLAFRPGLQLAPVYDMLPMGYAPMRGGELPHRRYQPEWPLPSEAEAWRQAGLAAVSYWQRCAEDARISQDFRRICAENAAIAQQTLRTACS